jgi:membrane-bound lytic murein transglycosylase A
MARRVFLYLLILLLIAGCGAPVKKPTPQPVPPPPVVKPLPPPVQLPVPPAAGPVAETAKPPIAPVAPKAPPALVRLRADQIPLFTDDMDLASLEEAIDKSLSYYSRAAGSGPMRMDDRVVTVWELKESLLALREILRRNETMDVKQALIRDTFDVYQSTGSDGKNTVLFTGYYEVIINGSSEKTAMTPYPVYKVPDDAVFANLNRFGEKYQYDQIVGRVIDGELIPYYTRSEIDDLGVLAGRNLEIAWVDDRISLFSLHTQGSGKIRLPDGKLLQVGYALKNGRPFRGLTGYLVETGKLTPQQRSYQSMQRYLREHPEELSEILGHNESFIFFREVTQGPVGSLGEIVTSGRSIATDAAVFPRGALAFMRARKPVFDKKGNVVAWTPFSRFVLSQDAGGAIKGAGHVDLFCGSGDEAERIAGSLSERGALYFLVKKRPGSP